MLLVQLQLVLGQSFALIPGTNPGTPARRIREHQPVSAFLSRASVTSLSFSLECSLVSGQCRDYPYPETRRQQTVELDPGKIPIQAKCEKWDANRPLSVLGNVNIPSTSGRVYIFFSACH
ncbi:hypothetical protein BZA70DRAFT_50357 [Myxozyma melibiosi]|uniref:Uncharacterized protein n=1 Tax=Myxozyma melibiosi TaxID=54550 RepID=A0ABR1FFV2_9ASCO